MKNMCVNSALEAGKAYVYLIKSQSARFDNHTKPYRDMIYIEYCRSDLPRLSSLLVWSRALSSSPCWQIEQLRQSSTVTISMLDSSPLSNCLSAWAIHNSVWQQSASEQAIFPSSKQSSTVMVLLNGKSEVTPTRKHAMRCHTNGKKVYLKYVWKGERSHSPGRSPEEMVCVSS